MIKLKNTTLFILINMFSGMGYSLVSPLFPSLGKEDNLGEDILGLIISTYSIASTILTPFVPSLIKKFSRINILCFATFFEATCTLLYGFLPFIHSHQILLPIIFLLRILHGCCSAIIATLVYSLTISLAEEGETQISLGNLEVGWNLGTSSGPLFASFFYKIGGYSMPFIVLGLFLYISVYIAKSIDSEKINKEEDTEEEQQQSFASYLFHPEIFLILLAFIICMVDVTFYFPCLTNHLTNNYNLSVSTSSLFFIIPIISYIIILQFLDNLSAKFGLYVSFSVGLIFSVISPLFLNPCPPIPKSLISIIFGFLLIGVGSAPVFIPGLVALAKNIKKVDKNIDELTANDISSAINNLTIAIGDFGGPIIGGFFTSRYNFNYCCFIVCIIGVIYSVFFILYFFRNIKEDINMILTNKSIVDENAQKKLIDSSGKIDKEMLDKEILLDTNDLNKSVLESNKTFLGNFKFGSFLMNRHSYKNRLRRSGRLSKVSLYSSLTN